ncbi:MAG: pilus assembly protein PilM, partial [Planctomycetes bacterium]|nr:pilus assembly protein PilM [Planctomycetota bacterium]
MSDYLALDLEIETRQLCGLEAEVSKGRVKVQRCFCLKIPDDVDPVKDPQQTGEWLKEELGRLGIGSTTVLLSLPREDAVVKHLDLPNVPDEELPDLVRLQAETKSATSLDKLHLDYLPLPVLDDVEGRGVLMVTFSVERANRIRSILKAAGLELESIGVSSVAVSELIARAEKRKGFDPNETILIVSRHGDRVEISIMQQRHLLFTHSTQLSGETQQENHKLILAEVNRSVVALSGMLKGKGIDRGWLIGHGEETRSLSASLNDRLGCAVEELDPFEIKEIDALVEIPEDRSGFSGPLGMLLAKAAATVESIDFLHPRKPVVKPDRTKAKMGIAAACLVLVSAISYGSVQMHLSDLDEQISSKRTEISKIESDLKKGKPVLASAKVIGEWDQRNINWLDEMLELNEILPGTGLIFLRSYEFNTSGTSEDILAKIEAIGHSRSRTQFRSFSHDLKAQQYSVRLRRTI